MMEFPGSYFNVGLLSLWALLPLFILTLCTMFHKVRLNPWNRLVPPELVSLRPLLPFLSFSSCCIRKRSRLSAWRDNLCKMVYRVSHFNMWKLQIAVLQDESSQLQGPLLSLRVHILCTITSFDPRVRSWQSCLECLDRNANCICYQRATLKYNPWTECTCYVFAYLPTCAIFAILCLRVRASESRLLWMLTSDKRKWFW